MFNVKKLVSFTLCSLIVFGLGACGSNDDSSATRKKAWYPPSSTPDASATPTDDASPVVGPDPANPHLIPRPFVNPDGSLNPPTEPDLTDHSEQGVRKASEFFMQVYMYYAQTNDTEYLKQYFDPESTTLRLLLEDWESLNAWSNGGNFYFLNEFETRVATEEEILETNGITGADGRTKAFYENDQRFRQLEFGVSINTNAATNEMWIYELLVGEVA